MATGSPAISQSATMKKHKQYTLVLPLDLRNDRVLLGYKLRGFGQGKYNGFGGKIEPNETIVAAAVRELYEESDLRCEEADMIQRGALLLETVADDASPILEIHVFTVEKWTGTEKATEEMKPVWFSLSQSLSPTPVTGSHNEPGIPSGSASASFLSTAAAAASPSTIDGNSAHDPHASSSSLPTVLEPIPYHRMWEESRVWLPHLLRIASSSPTSVSAGGATANNGSDHNGNALGLTAVSASAAAPPAGKYFIHHVQFVGGVEHEDEGNKSTDGPHGYSAWHKMGDRRLEWVDDLPFSEWDAKRTYGKYP